jgi:hypothetical protein
MSLCSLEAQIVRQYIAGLLDKRGFSLAVLASEAVIINPPSPYFAVPVGRN